MDENSNICGHELSLYKVEDQEDESKSDNGSIKWMSSKMRLMKRMVTTPSSPTPVTSQPSKITLRFPNQQHENRDTDHSTNSTNNNTATRVCSDCNTTTTPLWRSGPRGPKSLCNACGIRQRKARRAMAEAAAAAGSGVVVTTDASSSSSTKSRVHNKEKKSRTNHFAQFKNKCKPTAATTSSQLEEIRKLGFKDFALSLSNNSAFQQVFPKDEVAEAAVLLMELSCGFSQI